MLEAVNNWDYSVLDFIQQNLRSDFIDIVMTISSNIIFGLAYWISVPLILLLCKKYRRSGIAVIISIAIALILGNVILKFSFARPRPCWWDITGHSPIENMLVNIPSDFSFPSAHTFVSFSIAFTALKKNKAIGIPAVIAATFIALSRIYVYVHFPSDVITGFILSIPTALISDIAAKKIYASITARAENRKTLN